MSLTLRETGVARSVGRGSGVGEYMTDVRLIDTTIRDGQGSLWATSIDRKSVV